MTVSEKNTCPAQYGITGFSLGRYEGWKQTVCCAAYAGKCLQALLYMVIKLGQRFAMIGVPWLMQIRAHNQHMVTIHAHIRSFPVHQRRSETS